MTYAIVEVFKTLQGEGLYAGRSAMFVRFAGCNLWSGRDEHRDRDAVRNLAQCPLWCDTDFIKQAMMDRAELMQAIESEGADLVVFTGGEPLLQLDRELVEACNEAGFVTCVETNGTVEAKEGVIEALRHVCISPKHQLEELKLLKQLRVAASLKATKAGQTTELKVVFPAYDPLKYDRARDFFTSCWVSPEALTSSRGVSCVVHTNVQRAVDFCLAYPGWGLSLQLHKMLGLR